MSDLAAFDALVRTRHAGLLAPGLLAGVDEAGRGCLAGPVVAAAVVLPEGAEGLGIADSKTLSAAQRSVARAAIDAQALAVGVGTCSPEEIDRLNILHASMEAMRRAVANLRDPRTLAPVAPAFVLVDGNRLPPGLPCPAEAVVKGDGKSLSIAAASIVAKTTRDALMADLGAAFPAYGFERHAGYPTGAHYAALAVHGPSVHHRRTFRLS